MPCKFVLRPLKIARAKDVGFQRSTLNYRLTYPRGRRTQTSEFDSDHVQHSEFREILMEFDGSDVSIDGIVPAECIEGRQNEISGRTWPYRLIVALVTKA